LLSIFQDGFGSDIVGILRSKINQRHDREEGRVHDEPMGTIEQSLLLHLNAEMDYVAGQVNIGCRARIGALVDSASLLVATDEVQKRSVEHGLSVGVGQSEQLLRPLAS